MLQSESHWTFACSLESPLNLKVIVGFETHLKKEQYIWKWYEMVSKPFHRCELLLSMGVSYWHLLAHDFVLYYCTTREIIKESRTVLRYPEDGMILRDIFPFIHYHLEPQTTIYKWMFQLDDSKSLYGKWLFHQTSIYKWLFGVPGSNVISTSPRELTNSRSSMMCFCWSTPADQFLQPETGIDICFDPPNKKVASLTTIRGFSPSTMLNFSRFQEIVPWGRKNGRIVDLPSLIPIRIKHMDR